MQKQVAVKVGVTLDVEVDGIARMEGDSACLLTTLRRYVESWSGTLELVAQFPNRPPMVISRLGAAAP